MMIKLKSPKQIEQMKRAGELSARVLREVGAAIEPGISTLELDQIAERFIRSHGGTPTFKGYDGFPATICASVNEQVVHGIPSADVILKEGDIISIDTGATVDGWAGDNAWTYAVGAIDPKVQRLLDVTEAAMWAGVEQARPGNTLGDIGHAIQTIAEKDAGFGVVREFVGHGIGHDMHEEPDVPNYGHAHRGFELMEGMVLAIEPMVNMGTRKIRVSNGGWRVVTRDGKPSAHFEKTVAVTADGPVLVSVEPDRRRPM